MPTELLGDGAVDGYVPGLGAVVRPVGLGPLREADDVEEAEQVWTEAVGGPAVGDVQFVVKDRAGGLGASPASEDGVLWEQARDLRGGGEVGGAAADRVECVTGGARGRWWPGTRRGDGGAGWGSRTRAGQGGERA